LPGAASLSNLVVPGSATAGQDITVSFDIGPGCSYAAIALSPFSSFVCPSTNGYPYPWVLHDSVHYATGLDSAPDFRGLFGGGLYAGCGPATLSNAIRIPPDAPTPIYAHVFAGDATIAQPMVLWDLSYVGADPAPAVNGSYLRWDLGAVSAGSSGQICLWARITGYPQADFLRGLDLKGLFGALCSCAASS
jgi:hypothetical protein